LSNNDRKKVLRRDKLLNLTTRYRNEIIAECKKESTNTLEIHSEGTRKIKRISCMEK